MNRWTQTTFALVAATLLAVPAAHAQFQKAPAMGSFAASPYEGYGAYGGAQGPGYGGGYDPSGYGAGPNGGASMLHSPLPGPLAVGIHGAGEGLGYEGSYVFAHQVVPLCTDSLHGWWLIDARAALSEEGQPFANIGVVRRTHFSPMCADVGLGVFYDYDADEYDDFGHDFHQVGVSAHVWTHYFDLNINGYIPIDDTSHLIGTPNSPFFQDLLVVQLGVDSALEGFDMEVGLRPNFCAQHSGTFYFGGYAFQGDGVDPFGGFQSRFSFQPHAGWTLTAGITTDDEFDTNGLLQIEWNWGSSRGYSPTGRDLDPIRRNAHIVRANQTPIFGSDPDTGLLYRVVHVDNSVGDNGDGTVENPFNELADAEAASLPGNIIFVHPGLSTNGLGNPANLVGYDSGIVLQDDQFFLGEGVFHTIPTIEVGDFTFLAGTLGIRPSITNPDGPAVTLANNNVVAGFNTIAAETGIFGDGVTDAEIRDNNVIDSQLHGIHLLDSTGDLFVAGNFVDNSGGNGIFLENATGEATVTGNVATNNGIGNQAGLRIDVDGGGAAADLFATIFGNTFDFNGVGMTLNVEGAATTASALIVSNVSISDNRTDGVQVRAADGAFLSFAIVNNLDVSQNGQLLDVGTGVNIAVFDASAVGLVDGNNLIDNAGGGGAGILDLANGIGVSVFGDDGQIDLVISENLIDNTGTVGAGLLGDGIKIDFDTANPVVSTVSIVRNTFTDVGFDMIDIDAFGNARADIVIDENVTVLSGVNPGNIIEEGIELDTSGTSVMRVLATNNSLTDFDVFGLGEVMVQIGTADASRMIATFQGNDFDGNSQGLVAVVTEDSTLVLDFILNRLVNMADGGVDLDVFDNGTMLAIFEGNDITQNGLPVFTADLDILAGAGSLLGLQLTNNNVFGDTPILTNLSVAGAFLLENDGSNTPAVPITIGPITNVGPGTIQGLAAPLRAFP